MRCHRGGSVVYLQIDHITQTVITLGTLVTGSYKSHKNPVNATYAELRSRSYKSGAWAWVTDEMSHIPKEVFQRIGEEMLERSRRDAAAHAAHATHVSTLLSGIDCLVGMVGIADYVHVREIMDSM